MAKKDKGGGKGGQEAGSPIAVWTQRARGIGLLIGFAVTFWVSRGEGLPLADSALRGVMGAFAMSVVTWWCSLMVIRALMRSAAAQQNNQIRAAMAQTAAESEQGDVS